MALHQAVEAVIRLQVKTVAIPKRHTQVIKEMYMLQYWLPQRRGRRAYRCFHHPRFRAGYDFLLLRQQSGEKMKKLCDWWTNFQEVDDEARAKMIEKL